MIGDPSFPKGDVYRCLVYFLLLSHRNTALLRGAYLLNLLGMISRAYIHIPALIYIYPPKEESKRFLKNSFLEVSVPRLSARLNRLPDRTVRSGARSTGLDTGPSGNFDRTLPDGVQYAFRFRARSTGPTTGLAGLRPGSTGPQTGASGNLHRTSTGRDPVRFPVQGPVDRLQDRVVRSAARFDRAIDRSTRRYPPNG